MSRHVPRIPHTKSPTNWGHSFDEKLKCNGCERTWSDHQHAPTPCPTPTRPPTKGRTSD